MFPFFKSNKKSSESSVTSDSSTVTEASMEDGDLVFKDEETPLSVSDSDVTYEESPIEDSQSEDVDQLSSDVVESNITELQDIARRHMNGEELSDSELDTLADHCLFHIKHILEGFGAQDSKIDEYSSENGEFIFDVINPQLGSLIGHHGKTLEATQFLLNAILSQEFGFKYRVYLDVESYKSRQRTKLEQVARKSAARVRSEQRRIKLGFMSAYERRVVHMILNDEMGISTYSEGEDPYRRVVIVPKKEI